MSDQVYTLLKENENKRLKKDFIYDSFDEMIAKEPELIPYIKDFRIIEAPGKALGSYSHEERTISINKRLIERQLLVNKHMIAQEVIRHEMEHARNYKTLHEGKDDIESLVISCALRSIAMKKGLDRYPNLDHLNPDFLLMETKMNYTTDPGERLAEIKAWKYMVNLLKNQRRTKDLLDARTMLYYSYIRGYRDNRYFLDSPTFDFLMSTGMFHNAKWLKKRIDQKNYSFETRITYGLPVTYEELDQKVLEKVKLQKRKVTK